VELATIHRMDKQMSATYEEIEIAFDNGDLDTTYPPSVYEAFCAVREIDIEDLTYYYRKYANEISDNYVGYFENYRAFVEFKLDNEGVEIPEWIAVDYEASWNADLIHEYDFEGVDSNGDGHYFRKY